MVFAHFVFVYSVDFCMIELLLSYLAERQYLDDPK